MIFGCKDQNKQNAEEITVPEIKTEILEKKKTESIFDLIINKKETSENLRKEFSYDSIIGIPKEELSKMKKTGLNDGYYLTNYRFIKKDIDSIEFDIYYKLHFGSLLEKLVRIKRKDTIFDLSLSSSGGDGGDSWNSSSEFINNSIFIETNIYTETAIDNMHLMAYATDSIIRKYYYDENLNFREIKKDSFHIYKKYPTYHKNLKDKVFKTWSLPFSVNEIKYQWEYEVKYTDEINKNSKELLVNLLSQKLLVWKTKELFLDLDLSQYQYIPPKNISELEYNKYFDYTNDKLKDINFDGYDDFEFHDNVSGANQNYIVYLFNPNLEKFKYSKELSGNSLEDGIKLNKDKRIAYYSGKSGGGLYGFRRVHFNLDGSIKYEEKFWNENLDYYSFKDSINHYKYAFYYLKKKNKTTIDSLRIVKEVNDGGLESIYSSFFKWAEAFDK